MDAFSKNIFIKQLFSFVMGIYQTLSNTLLSRPGRPASLNVPAAKALSKQQTDIRLKKVWFLIDVLSNGKSFLFVSCDLLFVEEPPRGEVLEPPEQVCLAFKLIWPLLPIPAGEQAAGVQVS